MVCLEVFLSLNPFIMGMPSQRCFWCSVLSATFLDFAREEAIDEILVGWFHPMVDEASILVGYIPVVI